MRKKGKVAKFVVLVRPSPQVTEEIGKKNAQQSPVVNFWGSDPVGDVTAICVPMGRLKRR